MERGIEEGRRRGENDRGSMREGLEDLVDLGAERVLERESEGKRMKLKL